MNYVNYDVLRKTLKNLETMNNHYKVNKIENPLSDKDIISNEALEESIIQRFEICYECLWKTLRRHIAEHEGVLDIKPSPKSTLRKADTMDLLPSPINQWFKYLEARNNTTHTYDLNKVREALFIMDNFICDTIKLYQTLTGKAWE